MPLYSAETGKIGLTVSRFLTLWADFADFFHVVFGAVVDGVSHSALGNGLVLGGRRRAENSHIWHSATQLGGGDANTTCSAARMCQMRVSCYVYVHKV